MKFSFFLARKYLRPKRSVASAITCVSVVGVMLGVSVVIIVRSVMTGFGDIWEEKILDFKPHVSLHSAGGTGVICGEDGVVEAARAIRGVTSVTPEIDTRVLLSHGGRVSAPVILGVDASAFTGAYRIGPPRAGSYDLDGDSILLGVHVARQLGVWVGDEVTVYSPKTLVEKDEVFLPIKWRVSGIFQCGHHDYDSGYVVASLPNVRDLLGMEHGVSAIHLKTDCPTDPERFEPICAALAARFPNLRQMSWREADRELFNALAVEKNMTALLLSLISLVAVFCVMNTLLVLTVQKTPEVGLLKALGFRRREIMGVFLVHGLVQCAVGIALGLLVSWAVLTNLDRIVRWLAGLGVEVFPEAVYGLSVIPHRVIATDIFLVVGFVFFFGFLASVIPALLAAAKDPVSALNEQ